MAQENRRGAALGRTLLSGLSGGLLGAGVALLLTPYSGAELRRDLGSRARRAGESTRRLKGEIAARGRQLGRDAAHLKEEAAAALNRAVAPGSSADRPASPMGAAASPSVDATRGNL